MLANLIPRRKSVTVWNPPSGWNLGASRSTPAGVRVDPDKATTAQVVYSATTLIAEAIGSLPYDFVKRGDHSRVPIEPLGARPIWPAGPGPNAADSNQAFVESYVLSMLLWGNAYIYTRWSAAGLPAELWILDPGRVRDVKVDASNDADIGIRYEIDGLDAPIVRRRSDRQPALIHIKGPTKPGQLRGMSPVAEMANLIGVSLSAERHAGRLLGGGVRMGGVLEIPGSPTLETAREIRDGFVSDHSGPDASGSVGVLTGGAKFNTLTMPPAEMQFLEQMALTDRKLAAIYRVPPHMIGDVERSTSWGTGIEEQALQFVRHTLIPYITRFERAIETTILAGQKIQMRFALAAQLRGDQRSTAEFLRSLFGIGALSRNDIREILDRAPITDGTGDDYYVPANMIRAGDLGALTAVDRERLAALLRDDRLGGADNGR